MSPSQLAAQAARLLLLHVYQTSRVVKGGAATVVVEDRWWKTKRYQRPPRQGTYKYAQITSIYRNLVLKINNYLRDKICCLWIDAGPNFDEFIPHPVLSAISLGRENKTRRPDKCQRRQKDRIHCRILTHSSTRQSLTYAPPGVSMSAAQM